MDQQPGVACQRRFCVLIATSLKRQKGQAAVKYVTVITGASSGFGALTARRLAEAGHTVYGRCVRLAGEMRNKSKPPGSLPPRKISIFEQQNWTSVLKSLLIERYNKFLAQRDAST